MEGMDYILFWRDVIGVVWGENERWGSRDYKYI